MAIELSGSTGVIGPIWTTATRPGSPVAGQQGFNTTTGLMDLYNGTSWTSVGELPTIPIPKITNVQVTNSSYTVLDDTAVDTSGGYIKITGTGFAASCQVLVNNVAATSTTFVSSTEVRAQVPATAAGTYTLYVVNTDGGVAIRVNGITFSAIPAWSTGSTLTPQAINTAISIQLSATSNSNITYQLAQGSSLPSGITLSSGGLLSGTTPVVASTTVYSFTIIAIDLENQDNSRTFSITITPPSGVFSISPAVSGKSTWNLAIDGDLVLDTAGSWTITPSYQFNASVKIWGAGAGGNSRPEGTDDGTGGGGGFAGGIVTFTNGLSHTLQVGAAGTAGSPGAGGSPGGGNGGAGNNSSNRPMGGGGYSGLFRSSVSQGNAVLIAGGGGGSNTEKGGAGGGSVGQSAGFIGAGRSNPAGGGTQSAGGAGGGSGSGGSGSALQGGVGEDGAGAGGGGGGGYFGGGGGGNYLRSDAQGSGGGGSGYYNPTYVSSATLTTGDYQTPGNSADSDRGTAGNGGGGSNATAGEPGKIIIRAL